MGFAKSIHTLEVEGKEKHVPAISVSRDQTGMVVVLKVGKELLHPTSKEHHIAWVQLFGETQDGKFVQIGTLDFGQGTALPVGTLTIEQEHYLSLIALAYCNLHGVWENTLTL